MFLVSFLVCCCLAALKCSGSSRIAVCLLSVVCRLEFSHSLHNVCVDLCAAQFSTKAANPQA